MSKGYKSVSLLILIFFISGLIIRIISGNVILQSGLVYSPSSRESIPGTKTPEETAVSFYLLIDSGLYDRAWEISMEPDWIGKDGFVDYKAEVMEDPSLFSGWTKKEAFIERMKRELGFKGTGITLKAVEAYKIEDYGIKNGDFLKAKLNPEEVYAIKVKGNLLGACTIYNWEKDLIVLKIDGRYRVLLRGTKGGKSFFYQTWFSNIEKIGHIRGVGS